mgnify:CR=1 FL=1
MTKDYAKPSTTRKPTSKAKKVAAKRPRKTSSKKTSAPPPRPPNKAKLIPLLALLLGGFLYGLYALQSVPPSKHPIEQETVTSNKAQKIHPETEEAPAQRFKFYDILPESEVIPPKVDAYTFKEKDQSDSYYYMVQTGSFRSSVDAEKQKATIAFQGLKAQVKPVQSAQGSTWYRVITGPFKTRSEMNSALDKLVAIRIEPLVKKIKK